MITVDLALAFCYYYPAKSNNLTKKPTIVISSETSQPLFDGLPWNVMFSSGSVVTTMYCVTGDNGGLFQTFLEGIHCVAIGYSLENRQKQLCNRWKQGELKGQAQTFAYCIAWHEVCVCVWMSDCCRYSEDYRTVRTQAPQSNIRKVGDEGVSEVVWLTGI